MVWFYVSLGIFIWTAGLVFVLSLCKAAKRGDLMMEQFHNEEAQDTKHK